jgi:hypothetical protein
VRRLATPLVVVAAAAALLRLGGSGAPSSAVQYRHYFNEGRRACEALRAGAKPTPFGGIAATSGALIGVGVEPSGKLSPVDRQAFLSGCSAAS